MIWKLISFLLLINVLIINCVNVRAFNNKTIADNYTNSPELQIIRSQQLFSIMNSKSRVVREYDKFVDNIFEDQNNLRDKNRDQRTGGSKLSHIMTNSNHSLENKDYKNVESLVKGIGKRFTQSMISSDQSLGKREALSKAQVEQNRTQVEPIEKQQYMSSVESSADLKRIDTIEEEEEDIPQHSRFRRYKPINPKEIRRLANVRRKMKPATFVPVAAYSITKSKTKPTNSYRKRQGGPVRRNPDFGNKQTESAVYGYMQRPEIIEFRGQYFYGSRPGEPLDGPLTPAGSSVDGVRYPHHHYSGPPGPPMDPMGVPMDGPMGGPHPSASSPYGATYYGNNKFKGTGGLGPGGLLLATLPLILAPMLSYLFTPMIIPITATVAAGKRRKRDAMTTKDSLQVMTDINMNSLDQKLLKNDSFDTKSSTKSSTHTTSPYSTNEWLDSDRLNDPKYKEAQVVVEYLRKVQFDERATTRAVANYLQCDGMLADEDHCIERLSCEFSDPNNSEAPELDRSVTSIILGHILANEYITDSFKIKLKLAAIYGKDNPGKCEHKFKCIKVENSDHNM